MSSVGFFKRVQETVEAAVNTPVKTLLSAAAVGLACVQRAEASNNSTSSSSLEERGMTSGIAIGSLLLVGAAYALCRWCLKERPAQDYKQMPHDPERGIAPAAPAPSSPTLSTSPSLRGQSRR